MTAQLMCICKYTRKPEVDIRCLPQQLATLFFDTRPLTEPGTRSLARPAGHQALLSLPSKHWDFYVGPGIRFFLLVW